MRRALSSCQIGIDHVTRPDPRRIKCQSCSSRAFEIFGNSQLTFLHFFSNTISTSSPRSPATMFRRTIALLQEATRSSTASSSSSASSILTSHLSKSHLPPTLARKELPHKNLYQLLSSLPNDGVGTRVRQRRWAAKGLDVPKSVDLKSHLTKLHTEQGGKATKEEGHLCYWEITKVRLKDGGKHGKAWGKFVWRGESPIRQGTKRIQISEILTQAHSSLPIHRQATHQTRVGRTHPWCPQVLLGYCKVITQPQDSK